jgi:hypothetical protein
MNKVIVIFLIFVIFLAGLLTGISVMLLYKDASLGFNQQTSEENLKNTEIVKLLNSKVVSSIMAYGEVQSIDEKNITLSFSGENIVIKLADDVQILALSTGGDKKSNYQPYLLSQIKKNFNVTVDLKLSANGTLQGQVITVLPSSFTNEVTTGSK